MRLRLTSTLGALALFAILAFGSTAGVLAQATPEASPAAGSDFDLAKLPGLHQGVVRTYSSPIASTQIDPNATPTDEATPAATPDYASWGVVTLSAILLEFDSPEQAAAHLDTVNAEMTSPASTGGIELTEITVEGFPGPAKAYSASVDQGPGLTLHQVLLTTQDGPFIYQAIVIALSSSDDAQVTATDVVHAMIAAPAGEGEGTFVKDGTSTGGLWDKFPAVGDPALAGMKPELDDQVAPAA